MASSRILTIRAGFILFLAFFFFGALPLQAHAQSKDQTEKTGPTPTVKKVADAAPSGGANGNGAGNGFTDLAPEIPTKHPEVDPDTMDALLVLFRDRFYVPEALKTKYDLYDYRDFVLQETDNENWRSNVGIVTQYDAKLIQSKLLKGVGTIDEAQSYIDSHLKVHPYRGIDIPEIIFDLGDGKTASRYWVGQKGFKTLEDAQRALDGFALEVEKKKIKFNLFVDDLKENGIPFEEPEEVILAEDEEQYGAGYTNLEETVAMYLWEKADVERFSGKASDEPWFLWQSVYETTWRSTNYSTGGFNDLVGYFSNRIRVRGLKMPYGSSVDPFLEGTVTFSSDGRDFDNTFQGVFGLEYRLFRGMKGFDKYWFTSWIRNIRAHVDYWNRYATKDPITGSADYDLRAGVDVFKEWGIDIPEEGKPDLWWGEYFGQYEFRKTNFSFHANNNEYDAFLANTRVLLGIKFPTFAVPDNPINDHVTIMPYMGWEWINNNHIADFFENRYSVFAGVRWMPFRNKRHERREWLYKTKFFFEYYGIGSVQNTKRDPDPTDPAYSVNNDFRFGVNISSNRF